MILRTLCKNCHYFRNGECFIGKTINKDDEHPSTLGFCPQNDDNTIEVLIKYNESMKDLIKTCKSIDKPYTNIKSVTIIGTKEISDDLFKFCQSNIKNIRWRVTTPLEDISKQWVDWSLHLIKTPWIFVLECGTKLKESWLESFLVKQNVVCAFKDHDNFLIHQLCYEQLQGCFDEHVIEKIKKFDNWKETCLILH